MATLLSSLGPHSRERQDCTVAYYQVLEAHDVALAGPDAAQFHVHVGRQQQHGVSLQTSLVARSRSHSSSRQRGEQHTHPVGLVLVARPDPLECKFEK
jgi:hypothetical protein